MRSGGQTFVWLLSISKHPWAVLPGVASPYTISKNLTNKLKLLLDWLCGTWNVKQWQYSPDQIIGMVIWSYSRKYHPTSVGWFNACMDMSVNYSSLPNWTTVLYFLFTVCMSINDVDGEDEDDCSEYCRTRDSCLGIGWWMRLNVIEPDDGWEDTSCVCMYRQTEYCSFLPSSAIILGSLGDERPT